jgi:L-fucose isomerase-like protein
LEDIVKKTFEYEENIDEDVRSVVDKIKKVCDCTKAKESDLIRVASLKLAIEYYIKKEVCNCAAVQCWTALQDRLHIMPCLANALLTDEGIPVVCETDIHGAISSVMAYAATLNNTIPFFADITVRHPSNDNGELLWHCGNFPPSLSKYECGFKFGSHYILPEHEAGLLEGEMKGGLMTLVRFDGDHGEYQLLLGKAKGIQGEYNRGTYIWVEVDNWLDWEEKLVSGPYIHHCSGVHEYVIPALYEACKYIPGLQPDLVEGSESAIKKWYREGCV